MKKLRFGFKLPVFQRRIEADQRGGKGVAARLVEKMCILPIGGGLWITVRDLTTKLAQLKRKHDDLVHGTDITKMQIQAEVDHINAVIEEVGFYAPSSVAMQPDGTFEYVQVDDIVRFHIDVKDIGLKAGKKEKKVSKHVYTPAVNPHPPRNNNQQQQKKQNNQH